MALITLTFDNGPDLEVTPYVLDVLSAHDIKATFFLIGQKLAEGDARKAAERAKAEGHWLGNHSYTHTVSLGDGPPTAFDDEIEKTQQLLNGLSHPDKLVRPYCNSGVLDQRVLKRSDCEQLAAGSYTCVLFNSLPRDWEDGEGWVETAFDQIASSDWSTVVLHDIPRSGAMRQLDRFIRTAKDKGHEFTQDFTPECVPMRCGETVLSFDGLVSD